jgi:hypothetical protein
LSVNLIGKSIGNNTPLLSFTINDIFLIDAVIPLGIITVIPLLILSFAVEFILIIFLVFIVVSGCKLKILYRSVFRSH